MGKWDGDTLVVESNGYSDRSWLDGMGHPRSEATRITERLRRRDFGHMEVDVTIDDPKSYTKPFSIRYTQTLVPDTDILEYICTENEKDRAHLAGEVGRGTGLRYRPQAAWPTMYHSAMTPSGTPRIHATTYLI